MRPSPGLRSWTNPSDPVSPPASRLTRLLQQPISIRREGRRLALKRACTPFVPSSNSSLVRLLSQFFWGDRPEEQTHGLVCLGPNGSENGCFAGHATST